MSAGMWWGLYIIPSILTIAAMLWYASVYGKKQDKKLEERRRRLQALRQGEEGK